LRSRALAALEGAAARCQAMGAHASAARLLGDAVGLAADDADRVRLREARVAELVETNRVAETKSEAAALLALGRDRGDPGLQARAACWLVVPMLAEGHPADAVQLLDDLRGSLGAFVTEDPDGIRLL